MTPETLGALNASIAKWDANAVAGRPDDYLTGVSDCPLCSLFFGDDCEKCPVKFKAESKHCSNTPYVAADLAHDRWAFLGGEKFRLAAQSAARKEAAFLRSLLPGDAQ